MKKAKNLLFMLLLGLGTLLFNLTIMKLLEKAGLTSGLSLILDEGFLKALKDNPLLYGGIFCLGSLVITCFEELIFRYIPYILIKKSYKNYFWIVGLIMAITFATVHNLFGLSGIPIPQFIIGLVLWSVIRKGYLYALLVHLSYNLPVFISLLLQLRQ